MGIRSKDRQVPESATEQGDEADDSVSAASERQLVRRIHPGGVAVQSGPLFATLLFSVTLVAQAPQQPPDRSQQDLAVFAALLRHPTITGAPGKDGTVLIVETALSQSELRLFESGSEEYARGSLRAPAPQTIDQFLKIVHEDGELPAALGEYRSGPRAASRVGAGS